MKNAYANHVKMAFSTDADYYIPGMTRGEVVLDFLKSWKAAEIPAPEILTVNGYAVADISEKRGPIKVGLPADLIATPANPLQDIDALRKCVLSRRMAWCSRGRASWSRKSSSIAVR
jgi:imidazolonepropionase-like amidohydrolase